MTKMLVTGGAGFIGNHLVRRLVAEGHEVRVLDDYSRGIPMRLKDLEGKIETIQGDVCIYDDVSKATKDIEVVWHLAAVNGTENFYNRPERVLEVGVKGSMHTMDAAIEHGCKKYILASSSEVYQTPTHVPTKEDERIIIPDVQNPRYSYSGGKIVGELLALHYLAKKGPEALVFRPHNIYAADMGNEHVIPQFVRRLKELKAQSDAETLTFPIQGDGSQTRAFCYISDMIDGLLLLQEHGKSGEIYHIGTNEEVTIADVAHGIAAAMGTSIDIQTGDEPAGATPRRSPDIGKMAALGYSPKVNLEEGLKRTCAEELIRLDSES
jgi:nucleoside-diphosphate-sugar epimerase